MSAATPQKYANPSMAERAALRAAMIALPMVLGWSLMSSPFVAHSRVKSSKRVISDTAFRFLTSTLNINQLQYSMGTTRHVYEVWAKQNKLPVVIEELGEDARLLWVGPKRTDRVILYFHGGAYTFPMQDFAASFWKYVQGELKQKNIDAGFAILNYSPVPQTAFPTQLRQARLALTHIIAGGVDPRNIQIVGDSAGAHLALQLLSHTLHPLDDVPPVHLPSRIRGVYLMSPWVSLTADTGSHAANNKSDVISTRGLAYWGKAVLDGVPDSHRAYAEAAKAPESWFKGIDTLVDRILITGGEAECLRDDITQFADSLGKLHPAMTLVIQKHGVHNDPYFDFMAKESKLGELTPLVVSWLAAGFDS